MWTMDMDKCGICVIFLRRCVFSGISHPHFMFISLASFSSLETLQCQYRSCFVAWMTLAKVKFSSCVKVNWKWKQKEPMLLGVYGTLFIIGNNFSARVFCFRDKNKFSICYLSNRYILRKNCFHPLFPPSSPSTKWRITMRVKRYYFLFKNK